MIAIHPAYVDDNPFAAFKGTRDELKGGECLGTTARPDLMREGDIVTCVGPSGKGERHYYFDPQRLIAGTSWIKFRAGTRSSWCWERLA